MRLIVKISVLFLLLLFAKTELYAQKNPNIKFSYDTSNGCPPLKVTFTNKSTVGDSFIYNVNGQYLPYGDTSFIFTTGGYNSVYLYAYNKKKSIGYNYENIIILGNPDYIYSYDINRNYTDSLCINETIKFAIGGFPTANITGIWDFGDGTTKIFDNSNEVSHIFKNKGNYTVRLISTSICKTDTAQMVFKAKDDIPLIGNFSFSPENPMICPGEFQNFHFWSGYFYWMIDFDDGTPPSKGYSHLYNSIGQYNPLLKISNGCGFDTTLATSFLVSNNTPVTGNPYISLSGDSFCPGEKIMMNYSRTGIGSNITDSYWYFGDGNIESGSWNFHTYDTAGIYNVRLHLVNKCGNFTDVYKKVVVSNKLKIPNFALSISPSRYVCPGEEIEVDYTPGKRSIDFGDGVVEESLRTHVYSKPGKYVVKATSTNYCGNSRTKTDTVYVKNNLPISGDLEVYWGNSMLCPNETFDASVGPDNNLIHVFWDFGDGKGSAIGKSAYYSYDSAGKYTITCNASNGCGYDTILSSVVNVKTNIRFSDYIGNNISIYFQQGCPYGKLNCYSSSRYLTFWDFGDNTGSRGANVKHEYDTTGIYYISATMVNGCGNDTTFTDSVEVTGYTFLAYGDFFKINNPACPDNSFLIRFNGSTDDYSYIKWFDSLGYTTYQPDFRYSYPYPGIYPISVNVRDICGNDTTFHTYIQVKDDLKVNDYDLLISPKIACPGDNIFFQANYNMDSNDASWNFGNGDHKTGNGFYYNFKDTGTYNGSVTVSNNCGKSLTKTFTIKITSNAPNLNNFGNYYSISAANCAGDIVIFNSYLYNSNYWNFGDGTDTTTDQMTINHKYPKKGNYKVIFKNCNHCGNCYIDSSTVSVTNTSQNPNNTISWQGKYYFGDSIRFSLGRPANKPQIWDFGDGKGKFSTSLLYIYHVFDKPGGYIVSCNTVNNCGDSQNLKEYIGIDEKGIKPIVNFTSNKIEIFMGDSVNFSDLSNNNPSKWLWKFEGGIPDSSVLKNPKNIRYDSVGKFDVNLRVTNSYGTTQLVKVNYITVKNIEIPPVANFSADKFQVIKGNFVNYTDLSTGTINSWHWFIESGSPPESLVRNPINVLYDSVGKFDVKLVVANSFFKDSLIRTNYITVIDTTSGFEHKSLSSLIFAYPNPVNNELFLKIENPNHACWSIDFISTEGKIIWSEQLSPQSSSFFNSYNMTPFPKGLYLLKINSGEEQLLYKIIVN